MAKKPKHKNRGPQKPAAAVPAASRGRAGTTAAGESPAQQTARTEVTDTDLAGGGDGSPGAASITSDATATVSQFDQPEHAAPREDEASVSDAWSGDGLADQISNDDRAFAEATPGDAVSAGGTGSDMPEEAPAAVVSDVSVGAFDLRDAEVFDSDGGGGNPDDIRGVLIQLAGARLLLPNATIAEVLSYAEPDAIEGTPDWLLGRIRWRGWQLPLIAFAQLAGINTDESGGLGSKVVVLKALGGGKPPYFAVLTQGFPRLVTVSRSALVVDEAATDLPTAILAHVTLNRDDAYLPDLGKVEQLIAEAMAQAA